MKKNTVIRCSIFFTFILLLQNTIVSANELTSGDSLRIINPKIALMKSAIVPGWGHLYVHKPVKGLIYMSLEAYHIYRFIEYNSIYQHVKDTKEVLGVDAWVDLTETEKKEQIKTITGYELEDATWRPREIRNKYAWWCAGFYFIGMLDAFVDAHLYYFPKDKVELTTIGDSHSVGLTLSWKLR